MKIILVHRLLRINESVTAHVNERLRKLAALARIETAEVRLERHPSKSPPFSVRLHLAVPGPDLHVEETEHTLQAALHKAFAKLSRQIRHRKEAVQARRRLAAEPGRPRSTGNGSWNLQTA